MPMTALEFSDDKEKDENVPCSDGEFEVVATSGVRTVSKVR